LIERVGEGGMVSVSIIVKENNYSCVEKSRAKRDLKARNVVATAAAAAAVFLCHFTETTSAVSSHLKQLHY
jgi:hypothetical protein